MNDLHCFARRHALYATLLLGAAAVASYGVRVAYTDSWTFLFLPRNLALGWIPVAVALLVAAASRAGQGWLVAPLTGLWLLFLPNSVYLLTDLIHLRSRPDIPHVWDSTMCGAFAGAGIVAGVSALSIVEEAVGRHLGVLWTRLALGPVFLLTGLGVWLGRYERWNSWDIARDPLGIALDVLRPMLQPSTHLWGITLTYAAVLAISWLALVSVRSEPQQAPASAGRTRPVPLDPGATAR
ncbi:MAG: DUF1361 domain-containing protein [Myxococcota bacterium]